jgi:hypothetical protein
LYNVTEEEQEMHVELTSGNLQSHNEISASGSENENLSLTEEDSVDRREGSPLIEDILDDEYDSPPAKRSKYTV